LSYRRRPRNCDYVERQYVERQVVEDNRTTLLDAVSRRLPSTILWF